jgi:CRISPR-associated exonuclease Cas4
MLPIGLILILVALFLLWQSSRQRQQTGLPLGEIVYTDMGQGRVVIKPLYDPILSLVGKPDFLLEQDGMTIPVEVKSSNAPVEPYKSHIFQLAAYCLLAERNSFKRPAYGLIRYKNRSFKVDYTDELESGLIDILEQMRQDERRAQVNRSHDEPGRCAKCGYRSICEQKL